MNAKRAALRTLTFAGLLLAGCVAAPASSEDTSIEGDALTAAPHAFAIGMSNEAAGFEAYLKLAKEPSSEKRLCHVYTNWDVATAKPAATKSSTGARGGLLRFFKDAEATCDEVLVTFQGPGGTATTDPPSADQFEDAFVDFQGWTAAGQPLAAWAGRITYTAWNEPNNPAPDGNGMNHELTPELAADYYLRARKHCSPSEGCQIAAGDFATNGNMTLDIGQNCADDRASGNTTTRCEKPSSENPKDEAPTYLDRYKARLHKEAPKNDLGGDFAPEHWSYHPWHDVNSYIDSKTECATYEDCATRRLLVALSGSWSNADIWDSEIGLGLQQTTAPNPKTTQPCAAAFLVQLTDLSPRFTRLYFMKFTVSNGPLLDGFPGDPTLRPAGKVLAERETRYSGAKCAPTGISVEK